MVFPGRRRDFLPHPWPNHYQVLVAGTVIVTLVNRMGLNSGDRAPMPEREKTEVRDFTPEELAEYNGENGTPVYLSLKNIDYEVAPNSRPRVEG